MDGMDSIELRAKLGDRTYEAGVRLLEKDAIIERIELSGTAGYARVRDSGTKVVVYRDRNGVFDATCDCTVKPMGCKHCAAVYMDRIGFRPEASADAVRGHIAGFAGTSFDPFDYDIDQNTATTRFCNFMQDRSSSGSSGTPAGGSGRPTTSGRGRRSNPCSECRSGKGTTDAGIIGKYRHRRSSTHDRRHRDVGEMPLLRGTRGGMDDEIEQSGRGGPDRALLLPMRLQVQGGGRARVILTRPSGRRRSPSGPSQSWTRASAWTARTPARPSSPRRPPAFPRSGATMTAIW